MDGLIMLMKKNVKDIFMKIDSGIKASQKSRDHAIKGDSETINILESLFVK